MKNKTFMILFYTLVVISWIPIVWGELVPLPQPEIVKPIPLKLLNHPEIISRIFQLESSLGKHDSCRNKGKFNGVGWRSNKTCFDTQWDAWQRTDQWLDDHKNLTLPQQMCLWNIGTALNNCWYYRQYLKIN